MKQTIKQLITASMVFALVVSPSAVFAHNNDDGHADDDTTTSNTDTETSTVTRKQIEAAEKLRERLAQQKADRQEDLDSRKEARQERLEGAKKKACEKHQTLINRLMEKMGSRHETAFNKIARISEAVQKFYTEKNLSVANYDDLLAEVVAAKGVAQSSMDAQEIVPELDCDSEHPRADVTDFRQKRLDTIDAMKAYRDAVKSLAQAVRTAAKSTEGES